MSSSDVPFVADVDPDFLKLRADLRGNINTAELEFRNAIAEMLDRLPLADMPLEERRSIVVDTPARFIRGMLVFFEGLSEMQNAAELLAEHIGKQRQRHSLN